MIKPMTRQVGAVIAAILTIVSLLGASLVNPSVAHAVQTPGYTVSNIVVNNKALAAGQNVRRQLTPMTFDWSGEALNRTPKEGEGFEVAFPPQLQIAGSSLGKLDLIFEGKKIGDCNLSNGATSLISCVFDSGVNDITSKEVKGSGELKVIASTARREAYTADTIDFQVNGAPVAASIPGGIAKAADARYQPSKLSKYSTPIGERNKAVPWSIAFNPSLLAATVPSLGTPGNGNLTYRFIDTMGEGYDYETLLQGNPWTLQMVNSQDNPSMPAKRLADTNGASDPDYPGFSITVTGSGRNREVTVTGPFQPDTNYRLSVPGKLPGTAIPGIAYTNDVRIDGTNETASGTISYIKTAKVILAMRDGYGAVSIVKRVLGPAAVAVPTTTKYPVTINFTLPNGKTVADFPEWTDKPAGLNPSDTSGSVTFSEVVAGSFTNVPNTFPAGTTMTFEETPPAVPNIQWNTAKTTFEPKTLTVQEKQQSELSVSNVAQYADGTFQVKKTIADPKPADAPASVKLFYQCNADSVDGAVKANTDTELTANTDGTAVDGASFPVGTECKVTREADEAVVDHTVKADGLNTAVTLKEGKVADNIATVTNTYTQKIGTFQMKKLINAPADDAAFVAPKTVKFTYTCNADSVDKTVKAGVATEVSVPVGDTPVDGSEFPVGTKCTVAQESEHAVAGYNSVPAGLTQPVTITEGTVANNIATVTNTYTKQVGSFSVTKVVTADPTIIDLNPDHEYSFNYVCTKDGAEVAKGELKVNGANTVKSPDVPVGASCTVTEDEASAREAVDNAVLDVKVSGPAMITENTTTPVTVTNKYTRATSSFTVKKKVEGLPDPGAKEFSFLYKCVYGEDIKAGEIKVKGNGETTVEDVPAGSECTVTENVDAAKQDGYTLVVDNAEQKFDQGAQPTTVLFTNVYTKDTGSLSVTKSLKDPDGVAAGKKFNFAYACEHKDPAQRKEGTFQLGAGESTTIDDIAAESTCTITEKDADVKGADLATSGLDSVVIVKGKTHDVIATNDYSAWRGSVELSKALAGSGKDLAAVKDKKFNVSYVCTLGTDKKEVKKGTVEVIAGTPATIDDVRYGATCEFAEDTANAEAPGAMFDKNSSVTSATATISSKDTAATANLVNVYNVKGKVTLTKAVEGLAAGVDGNKSRDYEIEASWKDPQSGDTKTETYKVANGTFAELPELPAHTVITLKEKKPENTAITSWSTPGYTGDPAAAVKDNRDGTATVTIPADGSAVAVTLTNTANVPWWWIFVPLIPAAIIPNLPTTAPGSSGSGSTAPGHTAPAAGPRQNDPAPTQPTKATDGTPVKGTPKGHQGQPGQAVATPKDDAQKSGPARAVQKVLANTGASVIGIIVIAVLLLIAGLVLALRGRRSQ
ncbi:LPXTG-motif protein cell wall anchor domain protein [Corynebacterium durum F0235]|uniref:LPXTG-motif protein cell wall anchor domain protein n=2 Tax=Corynebacterium durum TaxID=61592 RepID=L1ME15_9CORY|nr:LPXTG-motif protein cell wall anchor domain protein [Corynebacterium durum F0235]